MRNFSTFGPKILMATTFLISAPLSAFADCSADIDKVENAVVKAKEMGIAETTAEEMRVLLDNANAERKKGDEAKCQEIIDQAKTMGNVD